MNQNDLIINKAFKRDKTHINRQIYLFYFNLNF